MKKILLKLFLGLVGFGYGQDCISGDCSNGEGILMYSDGSKFEGTFLKSFPVNGKLTKKNGDYILGTFIPSTLDLEGEGEIKQGNIFAKGTFLTII